MTTGQNQKTQQDNPPVETLEEGKGTPEKEPKTLEEQVAHIKEAAFAEVGRYRVETEKAVKAAEAAGKRLDKFIKEQEEAEEARYQDEPDKLTEFRSRRKGREREAELAEREQKLSDREAEINKAKSEQNISEVATRLNVNPKLLAKLAKDTDGSIEAIEAEAQDLPRLSETTPLKVDSGKTIGGKGGIPTNLEQYKKWVENLSQSEYEKLKPEIDKMKAAGKIK